MLVFSLLEIAQVRKPITIRVIQLLVQSILRFPTQNSASGIEASNLRAKKSWKRSFQFKLE